MKKSQNLIDIPLGDKFTYKGKRYESMPAEYFGAKGCMACDLFETGFGCCGKGVVCYSPPRIFKEVKTEDNDFAVDNDTPTWLIILLVIILVILTWPVMLGMWIMDRKTFKQIYKK